MSLHRCAAAATRVRAGSPHSRKPHVVDLANRRIATNRACFRIVRRSLNRLKAPGYAVRVIGTHRARFLTSETVRRSRSSKEPGESNAQG